ncbi:urate hydroxylase PuuD [Ferrovum sp.]|uniref:urate hydroxylase PuuD n=1 Tax=Ferrovum sp. TaxID=2609467 RepID=UPI00262DB7D7|nr:urate hydroxylase PuuD [Ferrovum sp.]
MGTIFQSLGRTVSAGFILLALILVFMGGGNIDLLLSHNWWTFAFRWLHVTVAIMWIGLLWYFNFVQIPSMPRIPDEQKSAISKVIAPAALFWFRWAALATVILGLGLASMNGYVMQALMLREGVVPIGVGMWMGFIMAFNVWFIIWPNQKKALGLVPVEIIEKPKAARIAMLTSRFNTMLSIPVIFCMVAQQHSGL